MKGIAVSKEQCVENAGIRVLEFKKAASEDLAGRYKAPGQKEFFAACTFLDPQFKDFRFQKDLALRSLQKQLALDYLKTMPLSATGDVSDAVGEDKTADTDIEPEPPAKRFKGNNMLRAYLADSDDNSPATVSPTETLQVGVLLLLKIIPNLVSVLHMRV